MSSFTRVSTLAFAALIHLGPPGGVRVQGAEEMTLSLVAHPGYLSGTPVFVRCELRLPGGGGAREVWDAEASLGTDMPGVTLEPDRIPLTNGMGSAMVRITAPPGTKRIPLLLSLGGLEARREIENLDGAPRTEVSGTLEMEVAEWSGVVHVAGQVTVAAGRTLRILPGTLVLIDGVRTAEGQPGACESASETPASCGTSIRVRGTLESLGSADEPVLITAIDPARAWGEIHHDRASPSRYEHTIVTRAGNSPRGGHTSTGPALRATDSRIVLVSSTIADTAGKTLAASGSDLEFRDCLLTRSVMGPEIDGTALIFEDSFSLEHHGSDDNDGIYLHDQRPGQNITLLGSVIAAGDDDGIDTLGSDVTIEDTIVRDFRDPAQDSKGISVLHGEVVVRRCIVSNTRVGISAKGRNGTGASVRIESTTIADADIGIEANDKFGEPDLEVSISVTSSIVSASNPIRTDYPPTDIQVRYSDVLEPWDGTGNISLDPLFVDAEGGDYRLRADSPCIDTGDPDLGPDPDGTRADMGALPSTRAAEAAFGRGRVNEDSLVDLSDAVVLLFHLFGGRTIACEDAADADDDGALGLTDVLRILDYLFRAGAPLAPPGAVCGPDPTPDLLGCESPSCG
ncbi:MAG TPA: hypothetical protein VMT52_06310 [Planctomycetota bacterium]|nr:hypothetical protein [Planctomycetota bacterium]